MKLCWRYHFLLCWLFLWAILPSYSQETEAKSRPFLRLGKLESPLIPESSGIVHCETQPNAFWTINDSGNTPDLFCVSYEGRVLGQFTLENAKNIDWESMSFFSHQGTRYLMIADVGDNLSRRASLQIYYLPEPNLEPGEELVKRQVRCSMFEFVYEDGARDCEGVAVDPSTGDILLVEKLSRPAGNRPPAGLYRIAAADGWYPPFREEPSNLQNKRENNLATESLDRLTAKRVGDFPYLFITGMNFSPDGSKLILRNYVNAFLFTKIEGQNWITTLTASRPIHIPLPLQRQGEAISFTGDSQFLIITSESVGQPIWRIDPKSYLSQPPAPDSPTLTPPLNQDSDRERSR